MKYITKYKKAIVISGSVILVLAIIGLIMNIANKKSEDVKVVEPVVTDSLIEAVEQPKVYIKKNPVVVSNVEKDLLYGDALALYKEKRIQLNDKCQASPNVSTYGNNTSIMIDNRSAVKRSVVLGSSFTIPAYGFKIVSLSSKDLPKTLLLDCDESQNVATVLIQK